MPLKKAIEEKKFDVRVVEKNVSRQVVRSADVDRNAQQLPDDSASAEWVDIDQLKDTDS